MCTAKVWPLPLPLLPQLQPPPLQVPMCVLVLADKAASDPKYRTSCIDDGMGNDCTEMPFLGVRLAKSAAKLTKMEWKVQTVLLHNGQLDFWLIPPWVAQDNNMQLTCWLQSMQSHHGQQWPAVVYRQIDGASVNVNHINFGVMAALVGSHVCDKMYVARLPPGHTHEDVDAHHSVIANYFEGKGNVAGHKVETVGSLPGLPAAAAPCNPMDAAIATSHKAERSKDSKSRICRQNLLPNVKVCWATWDFSAWMDQHVTKKFKNYAKRNPEKCYAVDDDGDIVDLMERKVARDFKFKHIDDAQQGNVKFHYKEWMQDELWQPVQEKQVKKQGGEEEQYLETDPAGGQILLSLPDLQQPPPLAAFKDEWDAEGCNGFNDDFEQWKQHLSPAAASWWEEALPLFCSLDSTDALPAELLPSWPWAASPVQECNAVPKLPKSTVVKKIPKNFVHHEGWGDQEVGGCCCCCCCCYCSCCCCRGGCCCTAAAAAAAAATAVVIAAAAAAATAVIVAAAAGQRLLASGCCCCNGCSCWLLLLLLVAPTMRVLLLLRVLLQVLLLLTPCVQVRKEAYTKQLEADILKGDRLEQANLKLGDLVVTIQDEGEDWGLGCTMNYMVGKYMGLAEGSSLSDPAAELQVHWYGSSNDDVSGAWKPLCEHNKQRGECKKCGKKETNKKYKPYLDSRPLHTMLLPTPHSGPVKIGASSGVMYDSTLFALHCLGYVQEYSGHVYDKDGARHGTAVCDDDVAAVAHDSIGDSTKLAPSKKHQKRKELGQEGGQHNKVQMPEPHQGEGGGREGVGLLLCAAKDAAAAQTTTLCCMCCLCCLCCCC
jgi:hypothetical protein